MMQEEATTDYSAGLSAQVREHCYVDNYNLSGNTEDQFNAELERALDRRAKALEEENQKKLDGAMADIKTIRQAMIGNGMDVPYATILLDYTEEQLNAELEEAQKRKAEAYNEDDNEKLADALANIKTIKNAMNDSGMDVAQAMKRFAKASSKTNYDSDAESVTATTHRERVFIPDPPEGDKRQTGRWWIQIDEEVYNPNNYFQDRMSDGKCYQLSEDTTGLKPYIDALNVSRNKRKANESNVSDVSVTNVVKVSRKAERAQQKMQEAQRMLEEGAAELQKACEPTVRSTKQKGTNKSTEATNDTSTTAYPRVLKPKGPKAIVAENIVNRAMDAVNEKKRVKSMKELVQKYEMCPPECDLDAVIAHLKWKTAPNITKKDEDEYKANLTEDDEYDKELGKHDYEDYSYEQLLKVDAVLTSELDELQDMVDEKRKYYDRKAAIFNYLKKKKVGADDSDYTILKKYFETRKKNAQDAGLYYDEVPTVTPTKPSAPAAGGSKSAVDKAVAKAEELLRGVNPYDVNRQSKTPLSIINNSLSPLKRYDLQGRNAGLNYDSEA